MKYVTFRSADFLAGVANMLECQGVECTDQDLLLAMKAPYIFHWENGSYYAGSRLYQPRWINPGLLTMGFRLEEQHLPAPELPRFLKTLKTAMLFLQAPRDERRLAVFTGFADGRYHFVNLQFANGGLPAQFDLSADQLKRRLDKEPAIFLLTPCEPEPLNLLPVLIDSMRNLTRYVQEVKEHYTPNITFAEYKANEEFWRTLMVELGPMAYVAGDEHLSLALGSLHHYHCDPFYQDITPHRFMPERRFDLNLDLIRRCLLWYAENLFDQVSNLCSDSAAKKLIVQSGLIDSWIFRCDPLEKSINPNKNAFFVHLRRRKRKDGTSSASASGRG